jgi:hypothetical protein
VHQHLTWKRLHQAFINSHRQAAGLSHAQFCALMAPPVGIALWLVQHRPDLVRRERLSLLVAPADEFEALDSGRWLNFIPWLVGQPDLQVQALLIGPKLVNETPTGISLRWSEEDLEHLLTSQGAYVVKKLPAAKLVQDEVWRWAEHLSAAPDVCIVASPALLLQDKTLLHPQALPALVKAGTAVGCFSTSELDQLVDRRVLQSYGWTLHNDDVWPSPFGFSGPQVAIHGAYMHMGWNLEGAQAPDHVEPDTTTLEELRYLLSASAQDIEQRGLDAPLGLGESLLTSGDQVLLRLPNQFAVEVPSMRLFQVLGLQAHEVTPPFVLPSAEMANFPGDEDLLARALWACRLYHKHIAPNLQSVDDALKSEFAQMDSALTSASQAA